MISELRWFFLEADGDLGLKSNFESVARRIGGIYGAQQTSAELDGRLLGAAMRHRRVSAAIRMLTPRQRLVLHAFAHNELLGVMLVMQRAIRAHRESRSSRPLADWLSRFAPSRERPPKPEYVRFWLAVRGDAVRELDRAMGAFDARWGVRN